MPAPQTSEARTIAGTMPQPLSMTAIWAGLAPPLSKPKITSAQVAFAWIELSMSSASAKDVLL